MSLIVDEHREYLADAPRVRAFRDALRARVKPGDVVVDLGAGTGVLGLLACQAGARRVYAIEASGMIAIAAAVARASGVADRVVHVHAHSSEARLPEKADGLVMDQIGHFGFEAGLFELMQDARRFLTPGAWTIPQAVDFCLAPVSHPEIRERVAFWSRPQHGLDFSPAGEWAANTGYPAHLAADQLLGPAEVAAHVELADAQPERLCLRARLSIGREGVLDGLGAWFRASLAPGVLLTNEPGAPCRIARRNVVFPLDAVAVRPGDAVDVSLQVRPADLLVTWRGTVQTAAGSTRFSRSTFAGMLLTRDDVRRLRPDAPPRLTERGRARLAVLQLCDGVRPLRDIERALIERHPQLFQSPAAAAVFVAEVVSRYAE